MMPENDAQAAWQRIISAARTHNGAVDVTDPTDTRQQRDRAVRYIGIGHIQRDQGDYPAALASYNVALGIWKSLVAADPTNTTLQRGLAVSHGIIGRVHILLDNIPDALAAYTAACVAPWSCASSSAGLRLIASNYTWIGDLQRAMGDIPAALAAYAIALGVCRALADTEPANNQAQWHVADCYADISRAHRAQGSPAAALIASNASKNIRNAITKSRGARGRK